MRLKNCARLLGHVGTFYIRSSNNKVYTSCWMTVTRTFSQWDTVGAVCLERKPIITQSLTSLEQKYQQYIQELELERSYLSDHEIRHIEDKKTAEKLKEGILEDMDVISNQTAEDFEDASVEEFSKYNPAPRITEADVLNNKHSILRKLDSSLVFIVKSKLGNEFKWHLPQAVHEDGETLRQTAERALSQVAACSGIQFMGNAPVGYYKYKYPKAVRGNGICGAKVFFFKAQLINPKEESLSFKECDTVSDYLWLTRSELKDVLQPVLNKTVQSFLLADTVVQDREALQSSDEDEHIPSPSVASQA